MKTSLWNIGLKIADLDHEIEFLTALGGKLLLREKFAGPDGESEYALLEFGGTRLFLTPNPVFENRLEKPLAAGLTHAVFETECLAHDYEKMVGQGCEVLIPPTDITAGFGTRRIAFFRSPGGLVFEIMQILEAKI
jgi:catechol 2,3-dioxygenase-like lactoylglutathione lyase family enzyme